MLEKFLNPLDNNIYKTGLYVKDSITGIGTLTFIDPETMKFGALGHEITEKTTGITILRLTIIHVALKGPDCNAMA